MRLQELRAQAAALESAQHSSTQMQDTLRSLTDELNNARQEIDTGAACGSIMSAVSRLKATGLAGHVSGESC
jgi:hypothetical protein